MAGLRVQNKLSLLSMKGMEQSDAGYEEVSGAKDQVASLMHNNPPADVATQAKTLEDSLTKIGGVLLPNGGFGGGRRGPSDPNAMQSFMDLNNSYNVLVSMVQVGLDMAPTHTQIATWQKDCSDLNRTTEAWKDMQKQLTDFNAVLAKNNLQQITVAPTKLTSSTCSFIPEASKKPGR
jgi:hypothetical protein